MRLLFPATVGAASSRVEWVVVLIHLVFVWPNFSSNWIFLSAVSQFVVVKL